MWCSILHKHQTILFDEVAHQQAWDVNSSLFLRWGWDGCFWHPRSHRSCWRYRKLCSLHNVPKLILWYIIATLWVILDRIPWSFNEISLWSTFHTNIGKWSKAFQLGTSEEYLQRTSGRLPWNWMNGQLEGQFWSGYPCIDRWGLPVSASWCLGPAVCLWTSIFWCYNLGRPIISISSIYIQRW